MTVIETTDTAQWRDALNLANERRRAGAAKRRELGALGLAEGLRLCARWLIDPPPGVTSVRLLHLLAGVHRVGHHKARRLVARAGIHAANHVRPVRALTVRQRASLAQLLTEWADSYEAKHGA